MNKLSTFPRYCSGHTSTKIQYANGDLLRIISFFLKYLHNEAESYFVHISIFAQSSGSYAQTVGLKELKLGVMMHHALTHLFQWFMMGIVSPISQSEQYKVRNRRLAMSR